MTPAEQLVFDWLATNQERLPHYANHADGLQGWISLAATYVGAIPTTLAPILLDGLAASSEYTYSTNLDAADE